MESVGRTFLWLLYPRILYCFQRCLIVSGIPRQETGVRVHDNNFYFFSLKLLHDMAVRSAWAYFNIKHDVNVTKQWVFLILFMGVTNLQSRCCFLYCVF